jgi:hypothetical protein
MSRRADRFADLVDGSAGGVDAGLGQLAQVAIALRATGTAIAPAPPSAQFRADLRQRLVAVATVMEPEPADRHRTFAVRAQRRVAALAGTVTLATAVAGVGVAAAKSLPGDPFYGVKRATEDVQLWTARGDLDKGRRHLEFAQTRLDEARRLHDPSTSRLASTLRAMDSQTEQGAQELTAAARSGTSVGPVNELSRFADQQMSGLVQLATQLSPAERRIEVPSVALVLTVSQHAHSLAAQLCPTCSQSGSSGSPSTPTGPRPAVSPAPVGSPSPSPRSSSGNREGGSSPAPTPHQHSSPAGSPTHSPRVTLPTPLPTLHLPTLPAPLSSIAPLPRVSSLLPLAPH